jgi:hypothetical protein
MLDFSMYQSGIDFKCPSLKRLYLHTTYSNPKDGPIPRTVQSGGRKIPSVPRLNTMPGLAVACRGSAELSLANSDG